MTDRAALVAAVEADPDSDLPRLVWADWLDDHGEPERAALIRAQIAGDPARTAAALDALGAVWPADLEHYWRFDGPTPEVSLRDRFHRGFLTRVQFEANGGLAGYLAGFAGREPLLVVILNADDRPHHVRQADGPHLAAVSVLYGENMRVLLPSPYLTHLRAMSELHTEDLRLLRTAAAGAALRVLSVSADSSRTDLREAAAEIAGNPRFASLRYLSFGVRPTDGRALEALVASPHLSPALCVALPPGWPRPGSRLGRMLAERFPGTMTAS